MAKKRHVELMASFAGFRGTEADDAKRQKLDEMTPMIDLAMVIALHLNIKGYWSLLSSN
jgi:hypothetical protein